MTPGKSRSETSVALLIALACVGAIAAVLAIFAIVINLTSDNVKGDVSFRVVHGEYIYGNCRGINPGVKESDSSAPPSVLCTIVGKTGGFMIASDKKVAFTTKSGETRWYNDCVGTDGLIVNPPEAIVCDLKS